MTNVQLWPLPSYEIAEGGTGQIAVYGAKYGALLQNPATAARQGIGSPEPLFVSFIGPPLLVGNETTYVVAPGAFFAVPEGAERVWVNAATTGHRFSGVVAQDAPGYVASANPWPPSQPTTLTKVIPSYLYQQYSDDSDLQAFVDAYNEFAQAFVSWFVTIMLPVYTNPNVNSTLLDWVAAGLYGLQRPVLPSTFLSQDLGAINTVAIDELDINGFVRVGPSTYYSVNDDVFRRILTWHLWKGDGKIFDIRWLKRRVMRFLTGANGGPGETDETYPVSVTFGPFGQVDINLRIYHYVSGGEGAIINTAAIDDFEINGADGFVVSETTPLPMTEVFKAAVYAGVLELPFQFHFVVNTN